MAVSAAATFVRAVAEAAWSGKARSVLVVFCAVRPMKWKAAPTPTTINRARTTNDFTVFFYSFLNLGTTPKGLVGLVDTDVVASQTFFDLKGMLVELEQLELREREVSALRHEIHETLDSAPNELLARREQEVSKERRQLHRRIDILRAELRRLNRRPA
jgi:hypothetical protein